MSAISHKVNTDNHLVNDYLRGCDDFRTCPGSSIVIYLFNFEPLLEPDAPITNRYPHYQIVTKLESKLLNNFFPSSQPALPPHPACRSTPAYRPIQR
jgi:hypothetical protein